MNLNASVGLHFNGDCEAAFKFYERLLDMRLELVLPWGASPLADRAPAGWATKILFARLKGRSMTLLGADALPGSYEPPKGFTLTLQTTDDTEAERFFTELAAGGTITLPLHETFWAKLYGLVVDRFGIPWEITCRRTAAAGG
jgi:PhnB protein